MSGPGVLMPWSSIADLTTNCWQLCWSLLVYDRWHCSGQQCCGGITAVWLLLLCECHRGVWRLLKQHELVAVKTRLLRWGWRGIVCMEKQRIWIRSTEIGEYYRCPVWKSQWCKNLTKKLKSNTGWNLCYAKSFQCQPFLNNNDSKTSLFMHILFLDYNKPVVPVDP